jgi:hypothetical protein
MELMLYRSDLKPESQLKKVKDIDLREDFYWYVDYHVILHSHQIIFNDQGEKKILKDKCGIYGNN